ncbi:MAG: PepSY-like domain-containing protein [Microscillaceae bacterium]|nr:PepSY-like domain-containing protein [Microscillaceae bacterium]
MKKSKKAKKSDEKVPQFFVPADILRVFKYEFPEVDASTVEWSWEVYNKIYEAEFVFENREYEVEITVTGHHLLTEIEIPTKELPKIVKKAVEEKYPDFEIEEVERIEYSNGDIHYEIDLKHEEKELEVHFREDGLFVAEGEDL